MVADDLIQPMAFLNQILLKLRALLFIVFVVVHTILCSICVITLKHLISLSLAMSFIRRVWARPMLWFLGIEVEVRGSERVKKELGTIVLFNHSSHLDILILFGYYPKAVYFGAKIELFKIPIFSAAMKSVGVLPIDRTKRAKVLQVYEAAVPRLKRGLSFALAPEGTRQTEARIGSFKRGPFEFACLAEVPVQPVVISGALRLLPNDTIFANLGGWKSKVILEILNPIYTYKDDDPTHLMEATSSHMANTYANLNEELGVI